MAFQQSIAGLTYAQNAGAALTNYLNYIAKVDADGDLNLCGAGQMPIGTITEVAAANAPATVQTGGIAKVYLAGTVTAGQSVASNAAGAGVVATAGVYALGIALTSGVSGDYISVQIAQHYYA